MGIRKSGSLPPDSVADMLAEQQKAQNGYFALDEKLLLICSRGNDGHTIVYADV